MLTTKQIIKVLRFEESLRKAREKAVLKGEKWAVDQARQEEEDERNRTPEGYW